MQRQKLMGLTGFKYLIGDELGIASVVRADMNM
jgi:hypothetical protein